jgi:hypothetical protein
VLIVALSSMAFIIGSATTNTCFQEGPSSPLAIVSESGGTVRQGLSWWPLGRECEWLTADGSGTVTTHSGDEVSTAALYAAALAGAAALVTSAGGRPPQRA